METPSRRLLLAVAWSCFLCSVGFFLVLAAPIQDRRAVDLTPRSSLLSGPVAALPYVLPLLLLLVGLAAYRRIAGPGRGDSTPAIWKRVQIAFFVMMGLFELNILAGAVLFLMGESLFVFAAFAGTTIALFALGLWRLVTTWPRD